MTATNHALTGTVIGLVVGQPLVAIPAAVASHYVCDIIPHFKKNLPVDKLLKSNWFRNYLILDASLCFLLVVCLAVFQPAHWVLAACCAFAAAAPDMLSVGGYIKTRRGQQWDQNLYTRFAIGIQWFQRPIGAVVEIAWFVAAIIILVPFLR